MRLAKNDEAARALAHVLSVGADENDRAKKTKLRDEYKALWRKFPMMVMRNGLLQTLSFYDYKHGSKPWGEQFFSHFCDAVELPDRKWTSLASDEFETYLLYTNRALSIAAWYKHFTSSQYRGDDDAAGNA